MTHNIMFNIIVTLTSTILCPDCHQLIDLRIPHYTAIFYHHSYKYSSPGHNKQICKTLDHSKHCVVIPLLFHVTGQELTAVQYEPPKPKPMVRPAYLYFMPSPAAMSFNFAVQSYQPSSGSRPPSSHDHSNSSQ